jgi:hypothetical protein
MLTMILPIVDVDDDGEGGLVGTVILPGSMNSPALSCPPSASPRASSADLWLRKPPTHFRCLEPSTAEVRLTVLPQVPRFRIGGDQQNGAGGAGLEPATFGSKVRSEPFRPRPSDLVLCQCPFI